MKYLLLLPALALYLNVTAQNAVKQSNKKEQTHTKAETAESYCCPACDFCSDKPGKCPKHKELVKSGSYYCTTGCEKMSETEGKCPKCNKDYILMDAKEKKKDGKKGK